VGWQVSGPCVIRFWRQNQRESWCGREGLTPREDLILDLQKASDRIYGGRPVCWDCRCAIATAFRPRGVQ